MKNILNYIIILKISMTNKEISAIFERIADVLELKEENIFRIRAYRTAAQNISGLARQLSDVYNEDPSLLDNIPGIGKDLKEKIIEMVTTGKLRYHGDLMKEFPKGFVEMLDLEGLGPKKLKKLKKELKIRNVDDLQKACEKGRLEDLEGMGAKTQEKLLASIKHYRRREGRMLLPEADRIADEVIDYLSKEKTFKRIEKAGSLRRGKETIGDLDILTVASDAEKAMDHFTSYREVAAIIAKGSTKSSVSLAEGPNVDLRVIDASCFGAAMVYFTGSKEHNVEIRKLAKSKGYKVSEYGVFKVAGSGKEKFAAGKTEEEVYKKLGMDWIPPELRESSGELEAAKKGGLPDLVGSKDIKGDLHMHTSATDGQNSPEEMMAAVKKKKYRYMAVTEHSQHVRVANGMDGKRLLKHAEKLRKLACKQKKIELLVGVEVDILEEGKLDLPDSVLRELDIVIAAVHGRFSLEKKKQTERILRAMDNEYVNVLAHPSGRLITRRSGIEVDFDRIFRKAAENNVFLEINTHGERIDLNDVNCRRAKELGARFVISTDAHSIGGLDQMIYGVVTARRGWLEKKDVLNTYTISKLRKELKK